MGVETRLVDWNAITDTLNKVEPILWALVLVSIYYGRMRQAPGAVQRDEVPPDYRALTAFVSFRLLGATVEPFLLNGWNPCHLGHRSAAILSISYYWLVYLLASICVFFFMAALIRKSLQPLPGLATAALIVFRWAALLALAIAATAHLPVFGIVSPQLFLNEISISFLLCICAFELSLLTLLLRQMRRLGMCLRSRPIGFALGLAMLSLMDLCNVATINLAKHTQDVAAALNEITNNCVPLLWTFYILRPEPKRLPHGLSPASRLMKWNEIALKLGVSGKQAETVPFISGVESTVDAILERFKGRAG